MTDPVRRSGARRVIAGPVESFPVGSITRVEVDGRAIALFRTTKGFFALRDACPHQGAALSRGNVVSALEAPTPGCYAFEPDRKYVRCPWHGWEYELSTGQSWFNPRRNRVRSIATSIVDGGELVGGAVDGATGLVQGPYTAERFDVRVEAEYVVLLV